MRIFINSHNRSEIISTPMLLDACGVDYTIILHNEDQRQAYLKNPKIKPDKLLVVNQPIGMTFIRNWILENIVKDGEWFAFVDDNITEFQCVTDTHYQAPVLPVKTMPDFYKPVFENKVDARRMYEVFEESIAQAEKTGAKLVGFASNLNFFFRDKKWREVGYVIGKTQLIKKTKLRYETQVYAMDDYLWTAQNLETFGKVLVNNYFVGVKKHYAEGGIGNYEDRVHWKVKDAAYIMERFPGLYRYKVKAGCHPKAELQLRFTNRDQVEKWRAFMRSSYPQVKA